MNKVILNNTSHYLTKKNVDIIIHHDRIIDIIDTRDKYENDYLIVDIKGRMIIPGLIDTHIQGAGGFDFLDGEVEAFHTISKTLARLGVTGYLATTVMKPTKNNIHLKNLNNFKKENLEESKFLGIHLEGPFVNPLKKGGLAPDGIYPESGGKIEEILELTNGMLKLMTIAPEYPENLSVIRKLVENQIVASFGHSNANLTEFKSGLKASITHVTHLFNAMPPIQHRNPGPIVEILTNNNIFCEVISDGNHLDASIIDMLYKLLGTNRIIGITDGVQAMGVEQGKFYYNEREYISIDGAAKYLDGTLIGTTMSLMDIMKKFIEFTNCDIADAVKIVSTNPARMLKLDGELGTIEKNKIADLVIIDSDYKVLYTMINGKMVYANT